MRTEPSNTRPSAGSHPAETGANHAPWRNWLKRAVAAVGARAARPVYAGHAAAPAAASAYSATNVYLSPASNMMR